jgi:hypothetical protein
LTTILFDDAPRRHVGFVGRDEEPCQPDPSRLGKSQLQQARTISPPSLGRPDIVADMPSALREELVQGVPETSATDDPLGVAHQPEGGLRDPIGGQIAPNRVIPAHLDKCGDVMRGVAVPAVTLGTKVRRQGSEVITKGQRGANEFNVL